MADNGDVIVIPPNVGGAAGAAAILFFRGGHPRKIRHAYAFSDVITDRPGRLRGAGRGLRQANDHRGQF
jgi:hypothetical protein